MPLRPALVAFHPRRPEPRSLRRVLCPQCGHSFEISRRAISVRCPQCTGPLQFSDMTLRHTLEGELATMGHIQLDQRGHMTGKLVCGQLTSQGNFNGQAIVYGSIRLLKDSLTTAKITARSLLIENGATFRGQVIICPKPNLGPVTQRDSTRTITRPPRIIASSA